MIIEQKSFVKDCITKITLKITLLYSAINLRKKE